MKAFVVAILSIFPLAVFASTAPQKELDVLKNIGGCFHVTYNFVEDGTHDFVMDDDYHEWISFKEDGEVLKFQHYGLLKDQTMKHWREEWTYLPDGRWEQAVIGPFEDSRYTCASPLEFNEWKCFSANAPKPNRDRNRKDYQTLDRDTALQFTAKGWIQNERNLKRDQAGNPVANEVGWIQYTRVENSVCGH